MSQEQPRRLDHEPIKYGEVFNVSGELASKPITPRDAATIQSVESQVLGQTRRGGPAAVMESAAAKNERAGLVSHNAVTNLARNEGVTISETNVGNNRVITETLGGQVVGQFVDGADEPKGTITDDATGSTVDEGVLDSMGAPKVRASEDYDFISNQGAASTLNARLSSDEDKNTESNVSTVQHENPDIISSVPGGMGASMATADHRVAKNK
ncbi:late embryogenesis abundant protein D-34-like [Gastrolobium bilobum]|uniref:late embryogenesis abundant protein D-34-like n=1 Tax=Gastrolobium bilobum TaxID=150636 RepID=UPI002AB19094|nr:late embryogenesis abundant protein D-34-like [Gastrolobium bilobum]